MEFIDLIKETRTVRKFGSAPVSRETLEMLVDCARFSPSGSNQQVLKFVLVNEKEERDRIFPLIKWAGALSDWDGPEEDQRPQAYIVILLDNNLSKTAGINHGIAAQSMMLGARAAGLGCCMIGAYDKPGLIKTLSLPEDVSPLLILALGEPAEEVVIDDYKEGSIAYYRDKDERHHVPKRTREDLIWK